MVSGVQDMDQRGMVSHVCERMSVIDRELYFFFFKDTATTEIYTGSLVAASDVYKRQGPCRSVSHRRGNPALKVREPVVGIVNG